MKYIILIFLSIYSVKISSQEKFVNSERGVLVDGKMRLTYFHKIRDAGQGRFGHELDFCWNHSLKNKKYTNLKKCISFSEDSIVSDTSEVNIAFKNKIIKATFEYYKEDTESIKFEKENFSYCWKLENNLKSIHEITNC